ncbi:MAG: hypothetical protein JSR91_06190 [Proteobacteria bacterium]|nr:hypothetical protein [Pseudomonadota bacterium]
MENLSPGIWMTAGLDHDPWTDRVSRQPVVGSDTKLPRAGDVLARIALVLLAHGAVVALVIWMLHAFGIH